MDTSNVIAFGSLLVAAIAVIAMLRANSRAVSSQKEANELSEANNKLNERLVVLEEERREEERRDMQLASLKLRRESIKGGYRLVAENAGPAVATDVCLYTDFHKDKKTVEVLNPGASISIPYVKEFGTSPPTNPRGHVTWKNSSGEKKESSFDLS